MKKKTSDDPDDDLLPHYDFDYSKMKRNPYASEKKIYKRTFVTLDEDVSRVFQSSEAVNTILRSAIEAMRTAAPKRVARTRATLKRTEKRRVS